MRFISNVLAYRLTPKWWELEQDKRKSTIAEIFSILSDTKKSGNNTLKAEAYESLRYDCNIIVWLVVKNPKDAICIRAKLAKALGGYAKIKYGFLSVFESKSMGNNSKKDYFVAYPVSKSQEWYLLDKGKQSDIIMNHINMAKTDASNKGINSYTTLSFGIDDGEFVVLYELDSIPEWVDVTQHLRSANAHRWVVKESPILVGWRGNFGAFVE